MTSKIKFFEAEATYIYTVGNKQDKVTVGAKSNKSKNEDDWKINLALDAGQKISKKFDTGLSAISLSLNSIELKNEDD